MLSITSRSKWMTASCLVAALGMGTTISCSESSDSPDAMEEEPTPNDPEDGMEDGTEEPDDRDDMGGTVPGSGGGPVVLPMEVNGTETPVAANYWPKGVDQGTVDPDTNFTAILMLQLRSQGELVALVDALYDPSSPQFRQYLSTSDFMSRFAPTTTTVDTVKSWLTGKGFKIEQTARNRLIIEYSGTVAQFNAAFGTVLHEIKRSEGTWRAPAYAPIVPLNVPLPLVGLVKRVLMPDAEPESGTLRADTAPILTTPPADVSTKLTPAQIAKAYSVSDLYASGYRGAGITIGVIGGTMFRFSDAQSMWQTFGISRKNPTVVETMEPMITRDLETSLDIQLAGALAPDADIIYYGAPTNSDTALLYTFNEAVGRAEAQVLSDSFAHAEATTPIPVSLGYNESALAAAALGITVLSAAGDSNQVDVPSNSPYVTAIGGTNVELNADNSWQSEQSWGLSGCGLSRIFVQPAWQSGAYAAAKGRRAVSDVSAVVGPYWVKYLGDWTYADGTSASTPVMAGIVAVVDQYRKAKGLPMVGLLNSTVYKHAATRAAFRDITQIGYGGCAVASGYDLATGLGSPKALQLAAALP